MLPFLSSHSFDTFNQRYQYDLSLGTMNSYVSCFCIIAYNHDKLLATLPTIYHATTSQLRLPYNPLHNSICNYVLLLLCTLSIYALFTL